MAMSRNTMNLNTLLVIVSLFSCAKCIMFHLHPNSQRCLREEMKQNELVLGEFEITEFPGQSVDYVVMDSKRNILAQHDNIKSPGKFTFITEHHDVFEVCFKSRVTAHHRGMEHEVSLKFKRSSEARQLDGVAEAIMLKPMEIELKKLEFLADDIVKDFTDMREREKLMRDTNESTNNRVLYLSIFSMAVLLSLSVWQVLYLKKFFRAKKLIE